MAKHISVKGVVQGVGFRPFVYGLATRLNLHGWVYNTSGGVEILVDGQYSNLEKFIQSLSLEKPPLAKIDSIQVEEAPDDTTLSFEIHASQTVEGAFQPISPDMAICPDCERELFNPKDKRYLYPFINCTHCGPRFTIIKDIPYDRPSTTMADFPMCEHCCTEYTDPLNRRFHAQPIACPECGPFVELRETHSQFPTTDPRISSIEIRTSAILKARRLLREGYIVAIKGLGGFHLACDASNPYTVAELRGRKGRVDKPFAVMAANIAAIASVCNIQKEELDLLSSREKPIVLLTKKKQTGWQPQAICELVAPNLDNIGVMLPYTPLHHLLLNQTDPVLAREPVPPILVMTSSNFSEEPIATDNKDALYRLSPLADAFLLHNRDIHIRSDDSVVKMDKSNIMYLRRSRGYAPYPVSLPFEVKPTLAVGGELKNTFCLTRDHYAFLSHHIGDVENVETQESFEQGIGHLSHIFRVEPELIAYDLHPNYFTTEYARRSSLDVPRVGVQHHHAHIASCMADNGLKDRRVIGLAFDGTGYGTDGAIWGGEALLASYADFERFAHLEYLPLPGGDAATRSPWRIAAGYAYTLDIDVDSLPFLQNIDKQGLRILKQQIDKKLNSPLNSSMGRLFDAVASFVGIRNEVSYEAQAAIEMEVLSKPFAFNAKPYPYLIEETKNGTIIRLKELLSGIIQDVRSNESVGVIGARFHQTIAEIAIDTCKRARESKNLNEVALSGGVWQNQILLDLVRDGLRREDFVVYSHQQVPSNDGGLALGQAIIANCARAARSSPRGQSEMLIEHSPSS
ncbi:MAG TPA: carbamoyltransferase HypF [Anaerolineales bacterium]|nr:carbamoyltransferase HypF [Anaerolineales bacterium]